jgi:hypothetical protein
LRVVPVVVGSHPGMLGAFSLLDFRPPDPAVVCLETMAGSLFQEAEAEVAAGTLKYDHLRALALSPAESARMVTDLLQ